MARFKDNSYLQHYQNGPTFSGLNEKFLIATSSHLAGLYNNTSVLENHHWSMVSNILCFMTRRHYVFGAQRSFAICHAFYCQANMI